MCFADTHLQPFKASLHRYGHLMWLKLMFVGPSPVLHANDSCCLSEGVPAPDSEVSEHGSIWKKR